MKVASQATVKIFKKSQNPENKHYNNEFQQMWDIRNVENIFICSFSLKSENEQILLFSPTMTFANICLIFIRWVAFKLLRYRGNHGGFGSPWQYHGPGGSVGPDARRKADHHCEGRSGDQQSATDCNSCQAKTTASTDDELFSEAAEAVTIANRKTL